MNIVLDRRSQEPPLISIVTPTFNAGFFVHAYLEALKKWKRGNIEVILIDGGSSDGTLEAFLKSLDVDLIVSEPDLGIFDAMNKGISLSRGQYVGILNADDKYLPSTIDLVASHINSNVMTVIYGGLKIGGKDTAVVHRSHKDISRGMIGHPAMFIAKQLYVEYGKFNTKFKVSADYDLTYRLYNAGVTFVELTDVITEYTPGGYSARHQTRSIIETTRIQQIHNNHSFSWFLTRLSLRMLKHSYRKLLWSKIS